MGMGSNTADQLMARIRGDDEVALEALYCHASPGLCAYLRKVGVGREDAADLVQEFYNKVWESRRGYRGSGATAWLYAIARNTAVDLARRQRRTPWPQMAVERAGASAEEEALATELGRTLDRALHGLPELTRDVVVLSRYSNLSNEEIGGVLGITEGNVKVRLHRGLKALMEDLDV
jgi:RNA polymerase sigma-70 factor (ECF subfamily)